MNPIRVLHCPTMVGGNPQGLARAERQLGLQSHSVAFRPKPYDYPCDEILFQPADGPLRQERKRWRFLRRALADFDLVHFNFGRSIMPLWIPVGSPAYGHQPWIKRALYSLYARTFELSDLRRLKRAGKAIVVTYQGDDARQGDFCREHFDVAPTLEVDDDYYEPKLDDRKRYKIALFDRYADRIYSVNPDLLHILPDRAEFLPYSHIDLRQWQPVDKPADDAAPPVVLHAPSHRGVKGSRFVTEAVRRLQAEGVPLKFVLVEGMTHADARRLYEQADVLVDQLLVGWYGGLAVELMALGKPVICYIRDDDLRFIPPGMRRDLPVINATPDALYEVLKKTLTRPRRELVAIGRQGRQYVEQWHDPLTVAARLKGDYENILASKRKVSQD